MKTKNKILALVEIAIVLCSLFLVALPAIAAEQNQTMQKASANTITTASEDDYVLGIYGNANEDDTIDMGDVVYTKLAIFGKKPKTELCDAKYDGRINVLDVIQTKLIILGKEKEITILDYGSMTGDLPPVAITVNKPVRRIVASMLDSAEILRSLNAEDKIVGVTDGGYKGIEVFYPELSNLPNLGPSSTMWGGLDYEAVLNLKPDIYLPFYSPAIEVKEKLPGVAIVYLRLSHPTRYIEGVRKLGYILDKEEEAEEFINWRESWLNKIKEGTEGLSEDEKPRVYMEVGTYGTTSGFSRFQQMCDIAGGKSISEDITTSIWPRVDPEWVIEQNPDIIIRTSWSHSAGGYDMDDPSVLRAMREEILNRPELAYVNAVKNRNVYTMVILDIDGTGCLIGTAYFAKWIQPELFEDLDPQAIHQEYLTRFQGMDYDLNEHGVFVYPPLED